MAKIRLTENQLKKIIKEAVEDVLKNTQEEEDYGDFTGVMHFLKPLFDDWGWDYKAELNKNGKWLEVYFKHRISMSDVEYLCAKANAALKFSNYPNFTCRWGIPEHKHIFHFTIYKTSDKEEQ